MLTSNIITTNTMRTVDLEIRKIGDDQDNKYGTRPEGGNGEWGLDFLVPVSYTHLDVYKRQT